MLSVSGLSGDGKSRYLYFQALTRLIPDLSGEGEGHPPLARLPSEEDEPSVFLIWSICFFLVAVFDIVYALFSPSPAFCGCPPGQRSEFTTPEVLCWLAVCFKLKRAVEPNANISKLEQCT